METAQDPSIAKKLQPGDSRFNNTPYPKLAIYYPEAGGALFARNLTRGSEGPVSVVMSLATGRSLVRKVSTIERYTIQSTEDHPEVICYRGPHPQLPELIDARHVHGFPPETVLLTAYCNGGDLDHFCQRNFYLRGEFTPEILVWLMLKHVLEALQHLHNGKKPVAHGDLHAGNVFMHWHQVQDSVPYQVSFWGILDTVKIAISKQCRRMTSKTNYVALGDI